MLNLNEIDLGAWISSGELEQAKTELNRLSDSLKQEDHIAIINFTIECGKLDFLRFMLDSSSCKENASAAIQKVMLQATENGKGKDDEKTFEAKDIPTPLSVATSSGHLKLVRYMLEESSCAHIFQDNITAYFNQALRHAVYADSTATSEERDLDEENQLSVVQYLLGDGLYAPSEAADPDDDSGDDDEEERPLQAPNCDTVSGAISAGIYPAIYRAFQYGMPKIAAYLLQSAPNSDAVYKEVVEHLDGYAQFALDYGTKYPLKAAPEGDAPGEEHSDAFNSALTHLLLGELVFFKHLEANAEYRLPVDIFCSVYLNVIEKEKQLLETENPGQKYDLRDEYKGEGEGFNDWLEDKVGFAYYILLHLIRNNNESSNEHVKALLDLQSLQDVLVDGVSIDSEEVPKPNALLQTALMVGNAEAATLLLEFGPVLDQARSSNFFQDRKTPYPAETATVIAPFLGSREPRHDGEIATANA